MATLEKAIQMAVEAHAGQVDKTGQPYILHPLTLMFSLDVGDEAGRITAVLHDVVEDSDVTFAELEAAGFSDEVLPALRLLTHDADIPYAEYIAAIQPNQLARRVKLADLQHNMNILRLPQLRDKDVARLRRYRAAWQQLTHP